MTEGLQSRIEPIDWPACPLREAAPLDVAVDLRLWLVDLSAHGDERADAALAAGLGPAERERAERFHFAADRRRFVLSRLALRALLARPAAKATDTVDLQIGAHGKPALAVPGPHFNLSRSGDAAVVALSTSHGVGVDLEQLRPLADSAELARAHFTSEEQAEWQACAKAQRELVFLLGWTRKEACLKAAGTGLAVAPSSFECGLGAQSRRVRLNAGERRFDLQVASLQPRPALVLSCAIVQALANPRA